MFKLRNTLLENDPKGLIPIKKVELDERYIRKFRKFRDTYLEVLAKRKVYLRSIT